MYTCKPINIFLGRGFIFLLFELKSILVQVKSVLMYGEIDGRQFEVLAYLYVIHHGSLPLATYVTFLRGGSLHGQTRLSSLQGLYQMTDLN